MEEGKKGRKIRKTEKGISEECRCEEKGLEERN